jgi:hypothetical protein
MTKVAALKTSLPVHSHDFSFAQTSLNSSRIPLLVTTVTMLS